MQLWVILYFSGFKSYQMKGSQFAHKDYLKVKIFAVQRYRKKFYLNLPPLTKAKSPENTAAINPIPREFPKNSAATEKDCPFTSIKKPNKTLTYFPLKP